jgi:putative oxidoreductase
MNTSPTLPAQSMSASVPTKQRNAAVANTAEFAGRLLLALLFLLSGLGKLGAYGSTAAYMSAAF